MIIPEYENNFGGGWREYRLFPNEEPVYHAEVELLVQSLDPINFRDSFEVKRGKRFAMIVGGGDGWDFSDGTKIAHVNSRVLAWREIKFKMTDTKNGKTLFEGEDLTAEQVMHQLFHIHGIYAVDSHTGWRSHVEFCLNRKQVGETMLDRNPDTGREIFVERTA